MSVRRGPKTGVAAAALLLVAACTGDDVGSKGASRDLGPGMPAVRVEQEDSDRDVPLVRWIEMLKDARLCESAASRLKRMRTDAVPILIGVLKEGDQPTKVSAAALLGELGPEAHAAVPTLIEALRAKPTSWPLSDEDEPEGEICVRLGLAVPLPQGVALEEPVVARVEFDDPLLSPAGLWSALRGTAADALGRIGLEARVAVPALEEMAVYPDETAQALARRAIATINAGTASH